MVRGGSERCPAPITALTRLANDVENAAACDRLRRPQVDRIRLVRLRQQMRAPRARSLPEEEAVGQHAQHESSEDGVFPIVRPEREV